MRLAVKPYCRLIRPMQVYHSKTTREDKPAPEIRWIIAEDLRIIGFDEFEDQIRLSVVRLDGKACDVSGEKPTEFFTEVPATDHLDAVVNDAGVFLDTETSQSHLIIHTNNFEYNIEKILGSEPLEFRQQYLPINQPIAEGSILAGKLYHCINLSPSMELHIKVKGQTIRLVSKTIDEKLRYGFTGTGTVYSDNVEYSCAFDLELLSKTIRKFPKDKQIQFFVTDEFIRFRYELGDIGYMNYYQRTKSSRDTYVI